ncbi:hypothetical protein D3C80_1846700 [compost metagenome]
MSAFVHGNRTRGRHALGRFGARELLRQLIELGAELLELSELIGAERGTSGFQLGQGLDLAIDGGAFATQLSYKGHTAS